jgi:hypothetical protein
MREWYLNSAKKTGMNQVKMRTITIISRHYSKAVPAFKIQKARLMEKENDTNKRSREYR